MAGLKVYKCKNCEKEYASARDPKAKKSHDRPQCIECGKRVNT